MKLTRRQAILGTLTLPLAAKASPEYEDGAALQSASHPHGAELADELNPFGASMETFEVEVTDVVWNARVAAMLAESYRQTAAVIYANTMNEAMPPRQSLLNLARNR